MPASLARYGYQLVETWGGYEATEREGRAGRFRSMTGMVPSQVPKMRALALRLRDQAHQTSMGIYQRKLEILASELEEAAEEAESRERFFAKHKLAS